jgi:hypothetical protein
MRFLFLAAAAALPLGLPASAPAHPGGLNAEGCHNNRETGDYHCHHGSGGSKASARSARSRQLVLAGTGGGAFANCTAARRAGAAPVRAGDPGYARHLDRDGDGVG